MTIKQKLIESARNHNYHEPLIIEAIKEFWNYDYSWDDIQDDLDLFYDDIMQAFNSLGDYTEAYKHACFTQGYFDN